MKTIYIIALLGAIFFAVGANANFASFQTTSSIIGTCPQGNSYPDGCASAPSGTIQFPNLLTTGTVVAVQVKLGTSPTDGTYTLTASGCSGSGFQGSVIVSGGAVSGQPSIISPGSGYTCRPTITPPAGLGTGAVATTSVYLTRPPWNVAGVDYYVGIPSGTILKDPTVSANLPSGASFSSGSGINIVTISSNNVTLNSFDFTLHGCVAVLIDAGVTGTIITKSKFLAASSCVSAGGPIIGFAQPQDASDLTITDSEIYGTGTGGMVLMNQTGNFTMEYTYCHDVAQHCVDFAVGSAQSASVTMKYNLVVNTGETSGSHGEFTYNCGGAYTIIQNYNTALNQWGVILGSTALLTEIGDNSCAGSQLSSGSDFSENVCLSQGIYADTGNNNGSAHSGGCFYAAGSSGAPATTTMSNDYIDYTNAIVGIKGGAITSGITYSGNLNISTGNPCTLSTCN